jgi:OFA family oxalate/formate antiporter-like MFS transporter
LKTLLSPNYPFSPKRFPFFYGWIILAVSTLGIVMSAPGQTIGVSVFTDYLIDAMDLSRVHISTAYMIGTITSAFFLPWSGKMFDRYGARVMVVLSSLLTSAILLFLSQCDRVTSLLSFGSNSVYRSLVGSLILCFGFFVLRFSGQGMLTMTSRAMLGKWFFHKRSLISAINGVIVTFTFSIAPLGFDKLIILFDWRGAWLFLSGLVLMIAGIGWLTFRDTPEECGLFMDGASSDPSKNTDPQNQTSAVKEFTLKEAYHTYTFWVFNLGLSVYALIITAITFHIVSIGEEMGLSRQAAISMFLPMSIVSIVFNFLFGWLSKHINLKYLLMLLMGLLGAGIFGIPFFSQWWGQVLVIGGFGASGGVFGPMLTVVWPTFFGREHLGEISSMNLSTLVFASAIGPFIFGVSQEWLGSYHAGVYFCLAMPVIASIMAINADNPQDQI